MLATFINFIKSKLFNTNISTIIPSIEKALETIDQNQINDNENMIIQEPKWQKWFPFSFVYGSGKFQPIYFFTFCFSMIALSMLGIKVYASYQAIKSGSFTPDTISTADLATVLTFISSLILLYNNNKKNYQKSNEDK